MTYQFLCNQIWVELRSEINSRFPSLCRINREKYGGVYDDGSQTA